jgi:hypothetical protein
MITCGLEHIRQPVDGHPLHGRLPYTPARLLAHGEDWARPEPVLFCEGEIAQSSRGHEALRLRRRIEAPIGGTTIRITDSVENCGLAPSPHNLLYHMNFGFPAIGPGTRVLLNGEVVEEVAALADTGAEPRVRCFAAGQGPTGTCEIVSGDGREASRIALDFSTASLPYLQVWTDLRPRAGILAIEPCTSERTAAGRSADAVMLDIGGERTYRLELSITGSAPSVAPGTLGPDAGAHRT